MAKKNKKTIKKNQLEKKEFFSTRISQLISIFCFIIGYLFYKYDEIILFNFKWWYFIILFLLTTSLILLILNIPIIKRKLIESNYWDASILISIYYAVLVSIPFYYGLKHIIYDFAKEPIITENCEILEIKKTSYRRGGDYYVMRTIFKGKEEKIDLNEKLYTELKEINVSKNHAIIKVKPSIFDLYILDNIEIQSKNIPN